MLRRRKRKICLRDDGMGEWCNLMASCSHYSTDLDLRCASIAFDDMFTI